MKRVYLDQKDFSRMAQGLSGAADYRADAKAYDVLLRLVQERTIRIYFSWAHIVEAFRYKGDRLDRLEGYCRVVDSLTDGHCIVHFSQLLTLELEAAMSSRSHSRSEPTQQEYPFGRYAAAIGLEHYRNPDLKHYLRESFRREARNLPSREHRARVLAMTATDAGMLRLIEHLPESTLEEAARLFPSGPGFYTREAIREMFFGSPDVQASRHAEFAKGVSTFRNLLLGWKGRVDTTRIASLPDDDSRALQAAIQGLQARHAMSDVMDFDSEMRRLRMRLLDALRPRIRGLADSHGLTVQDVVEHVSADEFGRLPSIRVVTDLGLAYLRAHHGVPGRARRPHENDVMDLYHLRNLPHVNYMVTDGFWVEVAKGVATTYQVRLLRNVQALADELTSLL